jgi:meiotically up-regulated gene 157 (Mug157) protein
MIKTGFRPSDSPNELPYNIPGNAMASSYLALVAEDILSKIPSNSVWYSWSQSLSRRML